VQTYNSRAVAGGGDAGGDGTIAVARRVLAEEGPGGFYGGVWPTMAGQALIKGVVFLAYDVAKARLPATALGLGLAAAFSGAVGSLVVTPVERLKVVMQAASQGDFAGGGVDCLRTIVAEDGVGGLLSRGLGATFLREVPAYASRPPASFFSPSLPERDRVGSTSSRTRPCPRRSRARCPRGSCRSSAAPRRAPRRGSRSTRSTSSRPRSSPRRGARTTAGPR